ncbi:MULTISPECIES: SDR family NAD(P)-dependent oxidoreductase [unclassified Sphingomonas]|uniref:SDR family NAD(P)-dependent oxidoreductase n=1 Tax=unclassified Sphingomonas TaxID=196159 RepID=UPI0006F7856E|nr:MULTISPECIES: SDR family oxidoreductase [unclassified Sphingomonas]KQX26292.1 2-deoxy-D-gluconate 3-dehydrogenase [Sphingomonas sp. Root1294]KQY69362.1 2-deoxy-D-gluconate 3-dehydrogenase [Sphingomonas sp. Root50]KRB89621.1 2-deoxy-D-gluconate 3-dehydrogenase [Sphingomonas sp. Root720]
MAELMDLSGKAAFVTGASGGLGAHFAGVLARAGAKVIVAARREEALADVAAGIRQAGGQCDTAALDVASSASVAAIEPLLAEVDIFVNNAGIAVEKPFLDQSEEDWDRVFGTNAKGMFLLTQAAARAMKARGKGGSIINVASILGLRQGTHLSTYAISKAAAVQLTKVAALELARFGIRVNALCPGYIETDLNRSAWETDGGKKMIQRVPQRRLGEASELDGPLLLLASDASTYMTGSVLVADGGHLVSSL